MKKYLFLSLLIVTFNAAALQQKYNDQKLYFNIGTGIAYDFNLSEDIFYHNDIVFIDVPLTFEFDYRFKEFVSIMSGVNIVYSHHQYKLNEYDITKNDLFIDIPLNFKFYPIADREESHYFFYIAVGLFIRTWPLNTYTMSYGGNYYQGNGYAPDNKYIQPGSSYMPVNVGTSLSIGNVLKVSDNVGIGLEIYAKYLFLPYINGYFAEPDSKDSNGKTYLNFWGNTGLKLFISFNLTKDRISEK